MKPHIRKRAGLWECFVRPRGRKGYGYTAANAWHEWRRITGGSYA